MSKGKQFKLTIPDEVNKWLEQESKRNLRSKSGEIILAVKDKMATSDLHSEAANNEKSHTQKEIFNGKYNT